jgi:hypothetical protein
MRQTPCRITAIFFRLAGTFWRQLYMNPPGRAHQSPISGAFPKNYRKNHVGPKSFFRRAVIPFRGRKQPDGSDLIVNGKGLS